VTNIGDILYVAHIIAKVAQVADHHIKGNVAFGVAEVGVAVDGRPAHVNSDKAFGDGFKLFFLAAKCIVNMKFLHQYEPAVKLHEFILKAKDTSLPTKLTACVCLPLHIIY
jgi:hypothetical protein